MNKLIRTLAYTTLLASSTVFATPQIGLTLPFLLESKDPDNTHAYRAVVWYQPDSFTWLRDRFTVYFAGGVGHWWANGAPANSTLNIVSIAPVVRIFFVRTEHFSPYIELSIGASYLSKTRFSTQNLGIHYAFQDEAGAGVLFGKHKGLYAGVSALHYSNGRLSAHNSGISVPLFLNVGYKFS